MAAEEQNNVHVDDNTGLISEAKEDDVLSQSSSAPSVFSDSDQASQGEKYSFSTVSDLLFKYGVFSVLKQLFFWFVIVYFQHLGAFVVIMLSQAYWYQEFTKYGIVAEKEAKLGWIIKGGFRFLYWFWYLLASLLFHWKLVEGRIDLSTKQYYNLPASSKQMADFDFFIFSAFVLSMVAFVLTLRKQHYRYQFERLAYCCILIFFFALSCLSIANMFHGLIYFVLPLQLVAMNSAVLKLVYIISTGRDDTFSYKHSSFLFRLSSLPNISFFLGWFCTLVGSIILTRVLINFPLFTCAKNDMFPQYWVDTCVDTTFTLIPIKDFFGREYVSRFPTWIQNIEICQFDEHAFWFANFAAFIAPFGGYFTATFKRSFKMRIDFGQGPFADRLDCLLLMGVFVYCYTKARLPSHVAAKDLLLQVDALSDTTKTLVFKQFGQYLAENNLLE